ncbi:MAG: hypothetical protein R3E89_18780 [Thiolinea sp.]
MFIYCNPGTAISSKRLLKTPKLYFMDTGLCAYLTQWSSPENPGGKVPSLNGAVLENWIQWKS